MKKYYSIAIDGPSGAGKSTIARRCASAFDFLYVDTGAIYRAVGLASLRAGVDRKSASEVSGILPGLAIDLRYNDSGEQRMFSNGEDISDAIRLPEVSICASDVSALPVVRSYLLEMQRQIARTHHVIMDGRDIGTVVLPNADLKIFLTASAEARAQRRLKELREKGIDTDFQSVLQDILYRDEQDSTRETAPLRRAEDAVLVDTTELNFEESFSAVSQLILERFFTVDTVEKETI
ncbi:MAG: (d)CMP kinase [Oscillospiraceae bacterium]|nr:(d)CMP kinase [Oscillospiraceae bacterium]